MTTPMEPFENADNLDEDVGLFEAATHSPVIELPVPVLNKIWLALDGSSQDETARGFADTLVQRTGARLETQTGATDVADILANLAAQPAELLILPVPFGQDYRELGNESLGSVADQLLLKAPCPVLCVRALQDRHSIQESLRSVLVPIAVANESIPYALGWAFRVTPAGGQVDIVAVADHDVLAEASHLISESSEMRALKPQQLSRALTRDIAGVVAAAQKRGAAENRTVHVETRVGQFIPLVLAELHGRPRLIIWSITRDHSSPAFHRAVDLLLSSPGPILIV